jgi:hypothetical protein
MVSRRDEQRGDVSKAAEQGCGFMGMSNGWISPEVPSGKIGTEDFAICFWDQHAQAISWMLRFTLSLIGCGVGYWISRYSDGLTEATALKLATGQQLPMVFYVAARLNPGYFDTMFVAFLGALAAEIMLSKGSCWCPTGETVCSFCVVYLVAARLRIPIFMRPSSDGCRVLAPFVCV